LSTETARPTLSVIVAGNGAPGALARCLEALEPQAAGVQVVSCEPGAVPPDLIERYPGVFWHVREGALVPELWRDGIRLAHGDLVALTISPMVPAENWVDSLQRALERCDAVGGAVDPAPGLRLVDAAEHLSRYARDMRPFRRAESLDLAGDNACYRRALLEEVASAWEDGFWEPDVHRALAARGARLVHDPDVVVRMGRSAGFAAFVRQRLAHGRAFGRARGAGGGALGNLLRVAATPLVPFVLVARTAREVLGRRRGRGRLLAALPFLACFDVAWALGEARGHLDALGRR
jgi:hypothetical protein